MTNLTSEVIILFNLNEYIGGGETFTLRFAKYLKKINKNVIIISSSERGWLLKESNKYAIKSFRWPIEEKSINYMNSREIGILNQWFNEITDIGINFKVFTVCMRDLHNIIYLSKKISKKEIKIFHGIYHSEDCLYLSSLSFNPMKFINLNQSICRELFSNKSLLFISKESIPLTLGSNLQDSNTYKNIANFAPIPIEIKSEFSSLKNKKNKKIEVICISRFVGFKIAAVIALIKFIKNKSNFHLNIIGYGIFKPLIDFYLFFHKVKNVDLLGRIEPNQLSKFIISSNIGYAQGTAILEIAKHGIPVIVAPYSNISNLFNSDYKTLGFFGIDSLENEFGDTSSFINIRTFTIENCINRALKNYDIYSKKTWEIVQNYSTDKVLPEILKFISHAKYSSLNSNNHPLPIKPPIIKLIIKKIIYLKNNFQKKISNKFFSL